MSQSLLAHSENVKSFGIFVSAPKKISLFINFPLPIRSNMYLLLNKSNSVFSKKMLNIKIFFVK